MIVDQNIYVLLAAEDRFSGSAGGKPSRATANPGFVTTLSADREQEGDETVAGAIAGWPAMADHGRAPGLQRPSRISMATRTDGAAAGR
jgi:predicted lactoylglutathione lyase